MWEPLSVTDYLLLSFAGIHQALVSATVVHLVACRKWPPYLVKNIPLVCVTGIAGCVHLLGVVMTFGFWEHSSSSLASNCFFQGLVLWTGAGLYYASAVVRVYRNYKVLVRHSVDMMSPTKQILLLQIPVWGLACFLLVPSVATMDFELNRCTGNARFLLLGAFNYGGVLLIGAAFLLYKMKDVRKQMNEYQSMTVSLGFLLLTTVAVDASAGDIAQDDALARRIALLSNMVRGALLFWPVIWTPLVKYVKKDNDYAERFSAGLVPSVTPAVLRASLADQLKVEELWGHFQKIAEERLSPAMPEFYKAVMERDKEEGHFERQAMTMDIVNTYVADNALCPVNISEPCRQRILASEVTRYTIFNEAAAEVLEVLRSTCEDAFQACPAYEVLLRRAEKDEAQLEALGKAKLVRKKEVGFNINARGDRSGPSRSDRWTNSTAAERRHKRLFSDDESRGGARGRDWFVPRLWCCSWSSWRRTASLASIGSSTSSTSNKARPVAGSAGATAAAGTSSADKRWRRNRSRHGSTSTSKTTPCTRRGPIPSRAITLGNRSELASQHGAGDLNSPLEWLAEEDMERRESSLDARANTGGLSSLSATSNHNQNHTYTYNNAHGNNYTTSTTTTTHNDINNNSNSSSSSSGGHLFGRTLTRTTTSSPLPERHGGAEGAPPDELEEQGGGSDASRGLNSPTTSLTPVHRPWPELPRPPHPQKQQQQPKRPPPTPWAPWRRQPSEPSIAPVTSSPAESHVNDHVGGREGGGGGSSGGGNAQGHGAAGPAGEGAGFAAAAAAVGRGPYFAARTVSSAGSLESLVMFLPPSPATPIRGAPEGGSADGKAERAAAAAAVGREGGADAEGRGSGAEDGRGASGGRPPQKGFVPIAPWRNWVNSTFTLEEEEEEEEAEEKKRGGDGEPFVETCADFVEKSGFVPATGFQPKTTWLQLALQKEETEKQAEEARQEEAEQTRRDLREKRGRGLIGWRGWHGGGGKGGKGNRLRQEATSKSPASCSPKSASALPGGEAAPGSRWLENSPSPPPRPLPYPLSLSSSSHSLPPASPSASQQSTSSPMPEVFPSLRPLGETARETSLTPPPRDGVAQSMGGALAAADEGREGELSPSPWPSLTMASWSSPSTHRHGRGLAAATTATADPASALSAPEGEREGRGAADELDTAAVEVSVAGYTEDIQQQQQEQQQTVASFKMTSVSPSLPPPPPPLPPPSPPPPAALFPRALSPPTPTRPPSPQTLPGDGGGRAAEEEIDQTPERPRSLVTTPPRAERPARARMAPAGARKATRESSRESASWGGMLAAGVAPALQATMTKAAVSTASTVSVASCSALDKNGLVSSFVSSKHPARAQPARAAAWRDPPPPQAAADRRATASTPAPAPAPGAGAGLIEAADAMRARSGGALACLPATSRPPSTLLPPPAPDAQARGGGALAPSEPAASAAASAAAASAAAAAEASRPMATAEGAMSTSSGSPSPPPSRPSPPPVHLMLSLTTVEAPACYRLFTPPSPAGRSSSSPSYSSPPMSATSSSFKSSPPQARPRLLPLLPPPAAVVLSGREFLPPSAVPPAWSLSDSSNSCCRSTNGGGGGGGGVGGMSSVSAVSACSEAASASPLIGMRFVFAGTDGGSSTGGGVHSSSRDRLRPDSWSDHGGGAPPIGVRASPPLCHPPVGGSGGAPVALCGVGRTALPGEEEKVYDSDAEADGAIVAPVPGAAVNLVPEKLSFEGGVGGRRGKRPRRYFFP